MCLHNQLRPSSRGPVPSPPVDELPLLPVHRTCPPFSLDSYSHSATFACRVIGFHGRQLRLTLVARTDAIRERKAFTRQAAWSVSGRQNVLSQVATE